MNRNTKSSLGLEDLKEAFLEYLMRRFTASDLAEYNSLFLQICSEYGWDAKDPWQQAYFEVIYIMDGIIPYSIDWEYTSPLTGLYYKENEALHPELNRPGNFVLIDGDWRIL